MDKLNYEHTDNVREFKKNVMIVWRWGQLYNLHENFAENSLEVHIS